jgi:glycosyltransferase involved in cell wall biosynthesis
LKFPWSTRGIEKLSCRVLYVVGQLGAGGLERQLCYLLQALDREHYRPHVAVWKYSETDAYNRAIQDLEIPLHRFSNRASGIEKLIAFRRLVHALKPEIVHSYSFHTNFAAWWATCGTPTIPIGGVRSDFDRTKRQSGPLLGRLSARWPDHQIFNSEAAAAAARKTQTWFVPKQLHVVRNGLDLDMFRPLPLPATKRPGILGVGSLLPVKRWDRLLRAARELKRRGLSFEIQIAGDGPLRGNLQQQIENSDLSDCVKLLGYRSDIAHLLAISSFLVHPSDSEGCPNVVMEAMACGRAVVATDTGDTASLVENEHTGFVVAPHDEESMVRQVGRLVSDGQLCVTMGKAARTKAEIEFNLERVMRMTLNVYCAAGVPA